MLDSSKLNNVQNTLGRFGVQARALIELLDACNEVGGLAGAVAEMQTKRERLTVEIEQARSELEEVRKALAAAADAKEREERDRTRRAAALEAIRREHQELERAATDYRAITADLAPKRKQLEEIEASLAAHRSKLAAL
jgi:chromosome segregation ATPase